MNPNSLTNQSAEVNQFLQTLDHPMKVEIEDLRTVILASNGQITERIKWRAPSSCIDGADRVTFRLPRMVAFNSSFTGA